MAEEHMINFQKIALGLFSVAILLVYFGVIYLVMAAIITNFYLFVMGLVGTGAAVGFLAYLLRRIVRVSLV